jgi:glycosyltransferase involved in cell wall biosynthesis
MSKLRLLYSSNAPWAASGYGIQSKSLLPRLAVLPEFGGRDNIGIFAWYGLSGGLHNVAGFQCYPAGNDPYGNDVIGQHTKHFGANVVVSLIDVWVMHQTAQKIAPALWLSWLPIDHDPVPQRVLDSLQGCHLPLTYAKWGRDMLTKAGVPNHYIPHGVEPTIYRVDPDRERIRALKRSITQIEDSHLSVMVAANKGFPDRKWFQGQLRAWAAFAKDKPNARLYIHSEPTPMYGGIEFNALVQHLGIAGRVIFPNRYENYLGLPAERLADIYNAADVLLSCSMSEGFGIPIVEAQACGTPVVVTDFSAMPELVRFGHTVQVLDYVWTPMNAYQAWPDVNDMTDKLNRLYELWDVSGRDWPIAKRIATQDAIHAEYDWDSIVRDQWRPLISRIAEEAPPLDKRFQSGGVDVPQPAQDDAQGFVDALNEELAQEQPKRRVAPLVQPVPVSANGYDAVSDEEVAL